MAFLLCMVTTKDIQNQMRHYFIERLTLTKTPIYTM